MRVLVLVVGVGSILAALSACGANVVVDTTRGATGGGGAGGASTMTGTSAGGQGGGQPCALSTSGSGGSVVQLTACFAPPSGPCPSQYDAAEFIVPMLCADLVSVDCGPVVGASGCCYVVHEQEHPCGN